MAAVGQRFSLAIDAVFWIADRTIGASLVVLPAVVVPLESPSRIEVPSYSDWRAFC